MAGSARRLQRNPEVTPMEANHPPSNWKQIEQHVYERDGYRCQTCGRRGNPYGDADVRPRHVVPKSRGGCTRPRNLRTLCRNCREGTHETHRLGSDDRILRSIHDRSTNASVEPGENTALIVGGGCILLPILVTLLLLLV